MLAKDVGYSNGDSISYEDYLRITKCFEGKCEYIYGRVFMFAGGTSEHHELINDLTYLLRSRLKHPCKAYSEFPWFYDSIDLNAHILPDISVSCDHREKTDKGKYRGKIKFIIEILSQNNSSYDREYKRDLYYNLGIEEYLIVDPELKNIEIFDFKSGCKSSVIHYYKLEPDYVYVSGINTDIQFGLKEIFD